MSMIENKKPAIIYTKQLTIDEFIEEFHCLLQDYVCPLCNGIYVDPILDSCAHIFCRQCFNTCMDNSLNNKCPIGSLNVDRANIKEFYMITVNINSYKAYCINKTKGCDWIGIYGQRTIHAESACEYQVVKCRNSNCDEMIERKDQDSHDAVCLYKLCQCVKCNQEIMQGLLMNHHMDCPKEELSCICGQTVVRDAIDEHQRDECPMTEIDCMFNVYGCNEKYKRNEKEKHNNECIERHNELALLWINDSKREFNSANDRECEELKEKIGKVSLLYNQLVKRCDELKINVLDDIVMN